MAGQANGRNCWAAILGDCGGPLTREHVISDCLFDGLSVTVQGFNWCKGQAVNVGTGGFASKILCEKHNNDLSNLDIAAKLARDSIQEAHRIGAERIAAGLSKNWPRRVIKVNQTIFAQWCLKTLSNFSQVQAGSWSPNSALVEIIFGKRKFPANTGLAIYAKVDSKIKIENSFEIVPIMHSTNGNIDAVVIKFSGFTFLASWFVQLDQLTQNMIGYDRSSFIASGARPMQIKFNGNVSLEFRR
ncbi:MAG TPA: hypothetical protein VE954_28795 [Oligoflexus sp.]|uniref:hypothetical protein n=1 Tax=Oligoflexus sp. TaxID=1971216 RepID=UPI002D2A1C6E|nr:hypothetical protein [Oligoflexus sp.]HYX37119.1 hypothetical protein [Oligoflexus sp.]